MRRIAVIGSSGSGKTTLARHLAEELGIPHLELDSVFHQAGWTALPRDQFVEHLARFAARPAWISDGNYTSQGAAEVLWPRADTIVWLDPPRAVVMARVVRRTLRRALTREVLWNGNREPLTNLFHPDPERNIVRWAWTRFATVRARYARCCRDGTWAHARVWRVRGARDLDGLFGYLRAYSPPPG